VLPLQLAVVIQSCNSSSTFTGSQRATGVIVDDFLAFMITGYSYTHGDSMSDCGSTSIALAVVALLLLQQQSSYEGSCAAATAPCEHHMYCNPMMHMQD
jgi:hypothetical protein